MKEISERKSVMYTAWKKARAGEIIMDMAMLWRDRKRLSGTATSSSRDGAKA
jgi:hypothetical protein